MAAPVLWRTSIILVAALIFMAIRANALRGKIPLLMTYSACCLYNYIYISDSVAVISLQQACGSNSSIYISEGSSATICATLLYIDGSPTLPRSVDVTLLATDITAQCTSVIFGGEHILSRVTDVTYQLHTIICNHATAGIRHCFNLYVLYVYSRYGTQLLRYKITAGRRKIRRVAVGVGVGGEIDSAYLIYKYSGI